MSESVYISKWSVIRLPITIKVVLELSRMSSADNAGFAVVIVPTLTHHAVHTASVAATVVFTLHPDIDVTYGPLRDHRRLVLGGEITLIPPKTSCPERWFRSIFTVKSVLRDHCHERPLVLKGQIFLAEGPTFQCTGNWTWHQSPPALRDHICMANGVVFQDRFYCIAQDTVHIPDCVVTKIHHLHKTQILQFMCIDQNLVGCTSATSNKNGRWICWRYPLIFKNLTIKLSL